LPEHPLKLSCGLTVRLGDGKATAAASSIGLGPKLPDITQQSCPAIRRRYKQAVYRSHNLSIASE
jgi:hypothetical protein